MSTISQLPASSPTNQPNTIFWLAAAIAPLALAPIWFALPPQWLGPIPTLSGLLLAMLLVGSAYTDLTQRKIYNWMTYSACAWAILINAMPSFQASGAIGMANSIYGAAACFGIMLVPFSLARGGAGDVKLATAIGALIGLDSALLVIAFTYIIAAIVIAGWTVWQQGPFRLLLAMIRRLGYRWVPGWVSAPSDCDAKLLDQPVPLAPFFAIATIAVIFDAPAFIRSL